MKKRVEFTLSLIFVILFIGKLEGRCSIEESEALLNFKQSLFDPYMFLSNWKSGKDCCTWKGVGCSNITGHVIKLDFLNSYLERHGEPSYYATSLNGASLFRLKHLQYLSLSGIYFYNASIPRSIDSLTSLRYLDLSDSRFNGEIPPHIGNLTNLQYLDLSWNYLAASNLQWLSQLSSLKCLRMSRVNLTLATNWLQEINMLPALSILTLEECNLQTLPSLLPYSNFSSTINIIDVSMNQFLNSTIPSWLSNMTNLDQLFMYDCQLHGMIPRNLLGAINLRKLDLANNLIDGTIPKWIGKLRNLTFLALGSNRLGGPIPHSLGQIMNLSILDLSNNQLKDSLSDVNFANLSQLNALDLSNNYLDFNRISLHWVPTFQISILYLASCFTGPHFPLWLQSQHFLLSLDLSNNGIYDVIPSWFWNISSQINDLELSHNAIKGELPMSLNIKEQIDLSSNLLEGRLPQLMSSVDLALFSKNKFSSGIKWYLNSNMSTLATLDLSENLLSDEIPGSICQMPFIYLLDLSQNNLLGEIPKCKGNISSFMTLNIINLANNNLWGLIPQWMVNLPRLQSLHINNNNFQGEIPFLGDCSNLIILDLGQNKFTGNIPLWIGDSLSSLKILRLRSNKLYGSIPSELSKLKSLQILDLADNFLSSTLPKSFKFLNAMTIPQKKLIPMISINYTNIKGNLLQSRPFQDSLMIDTKGVEREFREILSLMMVMDLSCNNLFGEVPIELMSLVGLRSLNLSRNQFTGHIPINIGVMQSLETLDLSWNRFSGKIPESIVNISGLNQLNLSYNQLSGSIPMGTQLDGFNESSYYGNLELCGKPLLKSCEDDEHNIHNGGSNSHHDDDDFGLFLGMGLGFVVGLWGVLGILLLKRSWAIAYFQLYDNITNNIYVFVAVKVNRWCIR